MSSNEVARHGVCLARQLYDGAPKVGSAWRAGLTFTYLYWIAYWSANKVSLSTFPYPFSLKNVHDLPRA